MVMKYLLTPTAGCDGRGGGALFDLGLRLLGDGVGVGVGLLFINSENAFHGFCGEVGECSRDCLGEWEVEKRGEAGLGDADAC